MIGRIRGTLIENDAPVLLVEASGVAYEVQAPVGTCAEMQQIGAEVILHTHLSVSENAHQLYGFSKRRDRQLFRNLIKINGVGPKLGLAILSGMSPDDFVSCVLADEVNLLVKIPGIGKKTAERLVIELRDKLNDWEGVTNTTGSAADTGSDKLQAHKKSAEVESALMALGYKAQQANHVLAQLAEQVDFASTETSELVRLALKSVNN